MRCYVETEEDIAAYLISIIEEGSSELLIAALGDVTRPHGPSELVRTSGLTRYVLYRALNLDAQSRFAL
jgi:probable addiction module antidote protein